MGYKPMAPFSVPALAEKPEKIYFIHFLRAQESCAAHTGLQDKCVRVLSSAEA
jgi:hypothetical protein